MNKNNLLRWMQKGLITINNSSDAFVTIGDTIYNKNMIRYIKLFDTNDDHDNDDNDYRYEICFSLCDSSSYFTYKSQMYETLDEALDVMRQFDPNYKFKK